MRLSAPRGGLVDFLRSAGMRARSERIRGSQSARSESAGRAFPPPQSRYQPLGPVRGLPWQQRRHAAIKFGCSQLDSLQFLTGHAAVGCHRLGPHLLYLQILSFFPSSFLFYLQTRSPPSSSWDYASLWSSFRQADADSHAPHLSAVSLAAASFQAMPKLPKEIRILSPFFPDAPEPSARVGIASIFGGYFSFFFSPAVAANASSAAIHRDGAALASVLPSGASCLRQTGQGEGEGGAGC